MKIRLRISIVHLYLSHHQINHFYYGNGFYGVYFGFHYKNDRLYYMSRVTKGARQRHFIFMVGISSGRRESETLGSL